MAVIERWFSNTGAGLADGTSWANRAELFTGGNWSSVITGFNFSVDSLVAYVGPGTYSNNQSMLSSLFANPPTSSSIGQLALVGCNSSGVRLSPNNPNWNCAQGPLDVTGYPTIESTVAPIGGSVCVSMSFVNITRTNAGSAYSSQGGIFEWGRLHNTFGHSTALGANSALCLFRNCELECSGDTFNAVLSASHFANVRILGNINASSGNRHGISTSASAYGPAFVSGCLVGVRTVGSTSNTTLVACDLTVINCVTGVELNTAASGGTACLWVADSMIANCTTGVTQPFGRYELSNVRLRNTSNVSPANELPVNDVLTAAGSDADEFVDAAGGDYRIKNTSIYWGRRIGAGDQPAAGGSGIPIGRLISGGV